MTDILISSNSTSSTMYTTICTKNVIYHANITCDDMSNKTISNDTNLSDAMTPDEYESFKTLLIKIVKIKNFKIDRSNTIEIIHSVTSIQSAFLC